MVYERGGGMNQLRIYLLLLLFVTFMVVWMFDANVPTSQWFRDRRKDLVGGNEEDRHTAQEGEAEQEQRRYAAGAEWEEARTDALLDISRKLDEVLRRQEPREDRKRAIEEGDEEEGAVAREEQEGEGRDRPCEPQDCGSNVDLGITAQPFERRGLKRSADHQPRGYRDRLVKPLPWEWDFGYVTNPSFPIDPSSPPLGGRRLVNITNLDELMVQYAALHKRIVSGELDQRFVVFVANPEYGYGNKIQVLVSTFVFALMSERAILIDWPETHDVPLNHRKEFPVKPLVTNLDHTELFEPPYGIQWDLTPELRKRWQAAKKSSKARLTTISREMPAITATNLWAVITKASKFESFGDAGVCGDLCKRDTEFVYVDYWDFFAALLINNRQHENVNRLLMPFHEQLLYVLTNALRIIRPTERIRSETEAMRDRILGPYKDEGILGIHLRTSHPEIPVDDKLLACFERFHCSILSIVRMIHCALSSGYKVWYLATETREWRDKFAALLRKHDTGLASDKQGLPANAPMARQHVKLIYTDADELERNSIEGAPTIRIRNGMIELFMLTACDDFMMLWGTTFGRLVAALGGFKEPITVMKHQQLCVRKLTSEPCSYMWPSIWKAPCYDQAMQLPAMLYSTDAICREL